MRFITLYSYSFSKSPKNLRLAIVACRISLILTIVSLVLFLLITFTLVKNEQQNSTILKNESLINESLKESNQTNINSNNSSINDNSQPLIKFANFDFSGIKLF